MTDLQTWHQWFSYVTRLVDICGVIHLYMWYYSFKYVTRTETRVQTALRLPSLDTRVHCCCSICTLDSSWVICHEPLTEKMSLKTQTCLQTHVRQTVFWYQGDVLRHRCLVGWHNVLCWDTNVVSLDTNVFSLEQMRCLLTQCVGLRHKMLPFDTNVLSFDTSVWSCYCTQMWCPLTQMRCLLTTCVVWRHRYVAFWHKCVVDTNVLSTQMCCVLRPDPLSLDRNLWTTVIFVSSQASLRVIYIYHIHMYIIHICVYIYIHTVWSIYVHINHMYMYTYCLTNI